MHVKCLQGKSEQEVIKLMQKSPYSTAQEPFGSPQNSSTMQPGTLDIGHVNDMFSQEELSKMHTGTGAVFRHSVSMEKSLLLETN